MLTRPRRLMVWGGAAVVIVVGAPIAYAPGGSARPVDSVSDGHAAPQNADTRGSGAEALPGNVIAPDGGDGSGGS